MFIDESEYLAHYGTLHKSGRYPWGSGSDPAPNARSYLDYVDALHKEGLTQKEIADGFGISIARLRARKTIARNENKAAEISQAQRLKDKGNSNIAIGKIMGRNESYIRTLLQDGEAAKADQLQVVSDLLKSEVADKKFLDVGIGVEHHVGVSATKLTAAVAILQEQGYQIHNVPIPQVGTGKNTTTKVLVPPGTTWGDVMKNRDKIRIPRGRIDESGVSVLGVTPPLRINPKRIAVKYGPDGGTEADGVIFVRPGVKDISLGNAQYAQVRIAVGDGHYLKGMAMYKHDLPDGVDLLFHTNKEDTGNKLDAMKKLNRDAEGNVDKDNPFGAVVNQHFKRDAKGNILTDANGEKILSSAMNIVREEGDWVPWSRTISTQMLSKQPRTLVKSQLDMTYEQKVDEFARLSKLTNPTVKRMLLEKFGDETDASAVHLEAAAINRRQGWHVILPVNSLPPTQVYAPKFRDGERVVLIRFPHAGTFEIPELVVNNNHAEARKLLGDNPKDAIGIHHSVAERLSGADFDGDTVLVIPNNANKVRTSPALEGLKNFNPRVVYRPYDGMKTIDGGIYNESTKSVDYGGRQPSTRPKGIEMGGVSNLITDMTLRGASGPELARAVRHSMVVIDAEKHHLNYKQSAKDNGIANLKQKYQGKSTAGASTIISRATAEERVPDRKPRPAGQGGPIDKATGERVFVPTNAANYRTGAPKMIKSTKLAETKDARTLLSDDGIGTPIERLYADHSNKLKSLANRARKDSVNVPRAKYSPSAKKTYAPQVKSLNASLYTALRNAPLERQAQVLANATIRMKLDANPNMDAATLKKIKGQALNTARARLKAGKTQVIITPDEWEAIQAGAISDSKLQSILRNADIDTIRTLATPRPVLKMTNAKTARAQAMLASGYTRAEIADALGVSLTTLDTATVGEESQ